MLDFEEIERYWVRELRDLRENKTACNRIRVAQDAEDLLRRITREVRAVRDEALAQERVQGMSFPELERKYGISKTHVQTIVKEQAQRLLPGRGAR